MNVREIRKELLVDVSFHPAHALGLDGGHGGEQCREINCRRTDAANIADLDRNNGHAVYFMNKIFRDEILDKWHELCYY